MPDEEDFEFHASPVYPQPTIDFYVHPNHNVAFNYRSYLTDSTTITVYWNTVDSTNGKKVLTFDYYDGTHWRDSIRQISHHYDPGILTQDTIYLYAVIDDHVNPPVYSKIKMDIYTPDLRVTAPSEGMQVILEPADTSMQYVSKFATGDSELSLPHVFFYNVPPGTYTMEAFLHDSTHHFDHLDFYKNDATTASATTTYKSPEWLNTVITITDWGGNHIDFNYKIGAGKALLYGNFIDTLGNIIVGLDIDILLMDDASNVVASKTNVTNGHYVFLDSDLSSSTYNPAFYNIAVYVPESSEYYWHDVRTERLISTPVVYGIAHYETDIFIPDYSFQKDFVIEKGVPGDPQGVFFHAKDYDVVADIEGAFITLKHPDPNIPSVHAVTNKYGIAAFLPEDLVRQTIYDVFVMWPGDYQQVSVTPTFTYTGSYKLQTIVGGR